MASIGKIARRTFLVGAAAVVGGVAVGAYVVSRPAPNPLRPGDGEAALTPFVLIRRDGITLIAPRAEMGQGTSTTWAALIAEELDVTLDQIRIEHGPPAKAYYNHAMMGLMTEGNIYDSSAFARNLGDLMGSLGRVFDMQVTGGSTSMKDGFDRMRAAGAAAREMLKAAAAEQLGLRVRDLKTEAGHVIAPSGARIPYTDLAEAAALQEPRDIALRDPRSWKILGKTQARPDVPGKATGTAQFSIDTRLPGMKFAAIRMTPTRGGMRRFDGRDAARMPGVEKVIDLGDGVAVVASNTWLAQQAVDSIEIDWGRAPYLESTEDQFKALEAAFRGEPNSSLRDEGDVSQSLPNEISAEYRVPFLAHATMEPMNATAWLDGKGLQLWVGHQAPTFLKAQAAEEAGISEDEVTVHVTLMGGGFGRRSEMDFGVIATRIAKALPGTPVQVTWSREEDMTHGFYRPGAIGRFRGAVRDGRAVLIDGDVAAPALTAPALKRWVGFAPSGPDAAVTEGSHNQPYDVPNFRMRGFTASDMPPVGFWRSVGASYNGFFFDSFMDELAHSAGADPLAFRMAMARDEWEPGFYVLEAVRDMSGWTGQTPEGVGRGVAMVYSFGTPTAVVLEVAQIDDRVRITQAWIAADPGVALDPGNIEAQLTGGLAMGLSAAIGEEITFEQGRVTQMNFPDYPPLRMPDMPQVSVRILENQPRLHGVGEVAVPPAAPALANALYDLTGTRHRSLPLNKEVSFWA